MARSRTGTSKKRRRESPTGGGLKVGLLAAVQDRQEPCIVDGCTGTWTYDGRAQLENLGRNAPAGRCEQHLIEELGSADREIVCKVDGCKRTWLWTHDLQLEAMFPGGYMPSSKPRKIKPPVRMCAPCFEKFRGLEPRSVACKVHGCSREAHVEKEALLRAWAAAGLTDAAEDPPTPRRMCRVCREYCRAHPDRQIKCIRAECDGTWTFKTGAQLQAFLAGTIEDPQRPCGNCQAQEAISGSVETVAGAVQVMPCVVPGCSGTWTFGPKDRVARASEGSLPLDRMCPACRTDRDSSGDP